MKQAWHLWGSVLKLWPEGQAHQLTSARKKPLPLPHQEKWGKPAVLEYRLEQGTKKQTHPLTACDFLGMGAGGCRVTALDREPGASVLGSK
jgi:hypothetical protein